MDTDNASFLVGLVLGLILGLTIWFLTSVFSIAHENSGYKDKLIIEYHCPKQEYERKLFSHMMETSGIQTNFINKEYIMNKYMVKCRLTNPE